MQGKISSSKQIDNLHNKKGIRLVACCVTCVCISGPLSN